jgi:hypothetical protein
LANAKKEKQMDSITLTIHNDKIKQEILSFLKRFSSDDLEFTSIEDIEDLKLLQNTRHEETVSFADYLKNAH